jgi:hypothetical protein
MNIQPINRSNTASVQRVFLACIVCGQDSEYADLDGPAFRAYYCEAHNPARSDFCCDHGAEAGEEYDRSLHACTCTCHY